jgi:phage-related protein
VAATAFAAAGAAVGALLKTSIEGYAEYEQLVGGVETLFGAGGKSIEEYAQSVGKSVNEVKDEYGKLMSAQDTMLKNANNAYKTAGMSANDYMANVTSFSASLISSLGGDTEKAANVADRVMRDISDNANKMGTDMQSIVDTYQSLSRGNYQMLDNLKLGYGGTKAELERLIADASKMSDVQDELNVSVKAGDMSFANIANAISVVQTKMGITGTTAKEAGSTIQGSVSAMQAAWSNLATGMADENANIDQLITNFVDSVGTAAENILPRITIALDGIIKVVEKLVPQIPPLIAQFLPVVINGIMNVLDGVVKVLPSVVNTIMEVIPQLLTSLTAMLPTIIETAIEMVVQVIMALTEMLPTIIESIMEVVPLLIDSLIAAIPQLIDAAIQLLMAIIQAIPVIIESLLENLPHIIDTIVNGLVGAIPQLVEGAIMLFMAMLDAIPVIIDALIQNLPQIITSIVDGLLNNIGAIIQGAIMLFMGIIKAIPQFIAQLIPKIPEIITAIVKGLTDGIGRIVEVGGQIVAGIWEGIKNAGSWLWDQVSGFFGGIVDGICGFLGIQSPSKLMEDLVGKNMALGIGVGFTDEMKDVNKQIQNAIQIDDVAVSAHVQTSMDSQNNGGESGKSVVVYQTNNYSQAHSRYEIYKSKQQTLAAVQLAMAGA